MKKAYKSNKNQAKLVIQAFLVMPFLIITPRLYDLFFVYNYNLVPEKIKNLIPFLDKFLIIIPWLLGNIICIILFIRWFSRAYKNLKRLNVSMRFSEVWTVTSWFVPILNCIRPYQMMKELWIKTQENIPNNKDIRNEGVVTIWWIIYMISLILNSLIIALISVYPSTMILIGLFFSLTALFLAIRIIQQVSEFEDRLYRSRAYEVDISEHLIG